MHIMYPQNYPFRLEEEPINNSCGDAEKSENKEENIENSQEEIKVSKEERKNYNEEYIDIPEPYRMEQDNLFENCDLTYDMKTGQYLLMGAKCNFMDGLENFNKAKMEYKEKENEIDIIDLLYDNHEEKPDGDDKKIHMNDKDFDIYEDEPFMNNEMSYVDDKKLNMINEMYDTYEEKPHNDEKKSRITDGMFDIFDNIDYTKEKDEILENEKLDILKDVKKEIVRETKENDEESKRKVRNKVKIVNITPDQNQKIIITDKKDDKNVIIIKDKPGVDIIKLKKHYDKKLNSIDSIYIKKMMTNEFLHKPKSAKKKCKKCKKKR